MKPINLPDYFPPSWKFGTDGIRGPVETNMHPLFIVKLGWSVGKVLKEKGIDSVIIGKDTRISGYMIESSLEAGFISAGMNVTLVGPMPTPGIAFLAKSTNQAGAVISASHNTFQDNGIKFFTNEGFKFNYELERKIENTLLERSNVVRSEDLGKASRLNDAQERYIDFCSSCSPNLDLSDLKLIVDCANGANYSIAPKVFKKLGADVIELGTTPNGVNINQDCGSTNPDSLRKEVLDRKADLGIAFDGDGDRLLFVDKKGNDLDGDDLLYTLVSRSIKQPNKGALSGVVGTLMTNKALEDFLVKEEIEFFRADVGDKYVLKELQERKWVLGGEPSGHIICLDSTTTGDALIASLKILDSIKEINFDISKALENFNKFPQESVSFKVSDPNSVIMDTSIRSKVSKLETKLGSDGRVLIRPSGTEDLIRVMVEAKSKNLAKDLAKELADYILKAA
tara:strand:- start:9337 stop:10698 length:1362 start_codon:yes stop_codon:yes gene_type:complete